MVCISLEEFTRQAYWKELHNVALTLMPDNDVVSRVGFSVLRKHRRQRWANKIQKDQMDIGLKWLELEMTRNDSKWLEMTRNDSKWLEMTRNDSKWLEMTRNDSKWLEMTSWLLDLLTRSTRRVAPRWRQSAKEICFTAGFPAANWLQQLWTLWTCVSFFHDAIYVCIDIDVSICDAGRRASLDWSYLWQRCLSW